MHRYCWSLVNGVNIHKTFHIGTVELSKPHQRMLRCGLMETTKDRLDDTCVMPVFSPYTPQAAPNCEVFSDIRNYIFHY